MLNGPPLPAPPSFTGLALAGLAALKLMERAGYALWSAPMNDRYPGYDVLAKRNSPSWNDQTRQVVDRAIGRGGRPHRFFTAQSGPRFWQSAPESSRRHTVAGHVSRSPR